MTRHLTETERIDAVDGALTADARAHLDGCGVCRQDVDALREMLACVAEDDDSVVPEPSPLFWNHFHARVAAAIDQQAAAGRAVTARTPWWRGSMRAWTSLAATAVIVLVAVTAARWMTAPGGHGAGGAVAEWGLDAGLAFGDDMVQWQFVADVLQSLESETVQAVLDPTTQAVDAALAGLTAAEREAFARLLQVELAEGSE